MNLKKLVFRADGNSQTGLGHLYRVFALIEMFDAYFEIVLVTRTSSNIEVIPKKYKTCLMPSGVTIENEPFWLHEQFNPSSHMIIADGYQFGSHYQNQIKKLGFKLMYVDDLVEGKIHADIVVNHAANINLSHYSTIKETTFGLGTDFAILRPLFLEAALNDRLVDNITDIFVCFGGADTLDLSLKAVQALLQLPNQLSVHIVLGAAYQHSKMFELAKDQNNITLYTNLDELALYQLMKKCQAAIAPASTIVYELCAIKMPVLSGYFVENQINIYNALLNKGAIFGCGDLRTFTVNDFKDKFEKFFSIRNFSSYIDAQKTLFDGQSPSRFLQLLHSVFIEFRKATPEDMAMVYEWSNDPLVRSNSYNSSNIDIDTHKKWFSSKIIDSRALFLIAVYDSQPAGIVRYEIGDSHTTVGVLVADGFRGKKLSPTLLKESAKEYFKQNKLPIFAYIKKENTASVKAFESAGYSYYKQEIVKGAQSFVYKLELNDHKK